MISSHGAEYTIVSSGTIWCVRTIIVQRNLPRKAGGWTGSQLLPLVLLSQKQDSNYLVVGVSPLEGLSGGESISEEQMQRLRPLTNFRQYFKLAAQLLGAEIRSICEC